MAVSKRLRFDILTRDNHACRYCGGKAPDVKLTVDHVVPETLGGDDSPENLVTACADCNAGKSSMNLKTATVTAIGEKARKWADALVVAARIRADDRAVINDSVDEFKKHWDGWTHEVPRTVYEKESLPLPENWRSSVERFTELGLDDEYMDRAIRIAMGNDLIREHKKFAYFCGICWKEIRKTQEVAAEYLSDQESTESVLE